MRVLAVLLLAACGGSPHHAASNPTAHACIPVRVVDDAGAPQAGWTVRSEANAWVGPEGAFYYEGGQPLTVEGGTALTTVDGSACVGDPRAKLADLRADATSAADGPHGSMYIPYAGGFGPTRVGGTRTARIVATRDGRPTAEVDLLPWDGGALVTIVVR